MNVENTNLISIEDLRQFLEILEILLKKFEESLKVDPDYVMTKNSKDDALISFHTAVLNKKLNEGKTFRAHEDLSLFYSRSQLKYVITEITKLNFKPAKPGLTHLLF